MTNCAAQRRSCWRDAESACLGPPLAKTRWTPLAEIDISPDVYLVDPQLGEGMDGIATLAALNAGHGARPARIVTANRAPQARVAMRAAGFEVMFKPVDPQELAAFVLRAEQPQE